VYSKEQRTDRVEIIKSFGVLQPGLQVVLGSHGGRLEI